MLNLLLSVHFRFSMASNMYAYLEVVHCSTCMLISSYRLSVVLRLWPYCLECST